MKDAAPVPGAAAVAGAVLAANNVAGATATLNAPTSNKSMAAGVGGLGGGGAGALLVAYLDAKGHPLSPELASVVGAIASTVVAWMGAFFMPLITAAQQAALRKLENER